jgi:hypothetical protein
VNLDSVERLANTLLYEGYLLYPYRPDSTKNRQRWNFGTLYPQAYSVAANGLEPAGFHAEFLVTGAQASVEVRLRFLQFACGEQSGAGSGLGWEQGLERTVDFPAVSLPVLQSRVRELAFSFPDETLSESGGGRALREISGAVMLHASALAPEVFRVSLDVSNTSASSGVTERENALLQALVSAHALVHVTRGELVSLLEPSQDLAEAAAACKNTGVFPVLAGEAPCRDILLISPIILYDYPQIAPESLGDFNDSTEMDEMLTLRVLTLTDEEKQQMRAGDPQARAILERTSGIGEDQFLKLHGAVRGLRRAGGKA